MLHWNPESPDNVVYATVDEAHSGSIDNVGSYLVKLKKDQHIGEEGYPKFVILGGDQQTYAHMIKIYITLHLSLHVYINLITIPSILIGTVLDSFRVCLYVLD